MTRETAQQTQLESYLLGRLDAAEMESFEERLFTDDEAFLDLQAAEMALVDRYVRNEMDNAERESFEANYLVSAERNAKLEASRVFHNELTELQPSTTARDQKLSWAERLRRAFLLPTMQYAGAALCLILAVSTGWLLLEQKRSRNELLEAQNSEQTLNQQVKDNQEELDRRVAEQRGEDSESLAALQNEIDDLQKQLNDSKIKQPEQNSSAQRQPLIATFILSAPRGASGAVPTINLSEGTKVLNLKLPLAGESAPLNVDISIGGKTIFSKTFNRLPKGDNPTVNIHLPTIGMVDGRYILTIREQSGEARTRSFIVARDHR